ncbi:Alkaline phosphatase D precursor [Polystyrenella longa]|uniref:Alkaline phosphatase D n=1 Tax=Polystyrenella longa TaxID=2528007 RepID=A0A518CPA2_9PLAN|nr:alkaline phosphatase D family protein [Polystyrenella longa]QDU81051.1 Alkaline phosphatase D precursor [Polystyrenella longa]
MNPDKIDWLLKKYPHRRDFLQAGLFSLASWPLLLNRPAQGAVQTHVTFKDYPFQLGIASGDPTADGVVLWTRLAPKPLEDGGMPNENVAVQWVVAKDEKLSQVVAQGETLATPELGHSVHVEVEGLEPDHWYFYQFKSGNEISPMGRTRTAPRREVMLPKFRFAFASCQHYETGYFTAYEHMAQQDLDLVVHLGDYIYEYKGEDGRVRKHVGEEIESLDDYRRRIAQYKMDPALQAMHAQCPWLVTWDDHEFDNNCANAISEKLDVDPREYLLRRANAYQAYYENMPLRLPAMPTGPDMELYRNVNFGRLIEFNVLDTRQYRTDQPCDDKSGPLCDGVFDPDATLLGNKQEWWLNKQLISNQSQWNVLAQQVMMGRIDRTPGEGESYSMDQWSGYDVARKRLLQFMAERRISNPIVLTGDIHADWVNDLKVDFDRLEDPTVATEFVGTSITSSGDGQAEVKDLDKFYSDNPFLRYHNRQRGYVQCEVTPNEWRADYQTVEYVSKPGGPVDTKASFIVENGKPGALQV